MDYLEQAMGGGSNYTEGHISDFQLQPAVNYMQTDWNFAQLKSAREQVQDEILTKVAAAIKGDDINKAKELLALAKQLKEL